MAGNTTGSFNTAGGYQALTSATTGTYNTVFGYTAGAVNAVTSGSYNTFIGAAAGFASALQRTNATAIGYNAKVDADNALVLGGTGADLVNVGIGITTPLERLHVVGNVRTSSLAGGGTKMVQADITGTLNPLASGTASQVLLGTGVWGSVPTNTVWSLTGNSGTIDGTNFIGTTDNVPFNVRVNNAKAARIDSTLANTFWGYKAGNSMTTGNHNTLMGHFAGALMASGSRNVIIGDSASYSNITLSHLVAVGSLALFSNTDGTEVTAIGDSALFSNTTGDQSTALGYGVLRNNTTGSNNIGIGYHALYNNTTGHSNTALGNQALLNSTSGISNTSVGKRAGYSNITGFRNTFLGDSADVDFFNQTNATAIGWNAHVNTSNSMVLGSINGVNGATSSVNVGMGLINPSTRLEVNGGFTISDTVYNVTAAFTLTVGNRSYFRIASTVVPSTAIATLSNGLAVGQILVIESTAAATSGIRIADNAVTNNTNTPVNRDLLQNDIVTLIWNGTDWLEISYTDN